MIRRTILLLIAFVLLANRADAHFLFVRVLPAISIAEMRELVAETSEEKK